MSLNDPAGGGLPNMSDVTEQPIALSFTRLSTFEQCPLKFEYLYVSRSVVDEGSVHSHFGDRVHASLEAYGKSGDPTLLTDETGGFKGLVDTIRAQPGEKFWEYQMALDENRRPCDWFSKEARLRGIADVLVLQGDRAVCLDWKTGKVKPNSSQLALFACIVFRHFPEINEVVASFVWLKHGQVTNRTFTRGEALLSLWPDFEQRFGAVHGAVKLGYFKPKPGPMCMWCPARKRCAYAK